MIPELNDEHDPLARHAKLDKFFASTLLALIFLFLLFATIRTLTRVTCFDSVQRCLKDTWVSCHQSLFSPPRKKPKKKLSQLDDSQ